MKKTSPERMRIIPALGAALVLFAAAANGTDILAGLGLTRASAGEGILEALVSGTPYNEAAMKVFKALPAASRSATVTAGLGWIKAYAGSGEFAAAYAARVFAAAWLVELEKAGIPGR